MRFLLAAVLLASGTLIVSAAPPTPENGALIFTENGSCLVSAYTKSTYSHVALVLYESGEPIVFEAKPGGVIKTKYERYLATATAGKLNNGESVRLWLMNPRIDYRQGELHPMLVYANQELGTPYSVLPTVTGKTLNTQQCAQYVSSILETTPRFWFRDCKYQTPATLLRIARPGYGSMHLILERKSESSSVFARIFAAWK